MDSVKLMPPPPPRLTERRHGESLFVGIGKTTILADMDFETYSPAGFVWNEELQKFYPPKGANKKGLPAVGTAVYTEHPDAEVLSLAYDLKDGRGARLWTPENQHSLDDLFDHIKSGKLIEAWNCAFERWVWENICVPKYGWPSLPFDCLRDAMAKSRAFGLPGSLEAAGEVLSISKKKDKKGKALLQKFSIPRNPTKKDLRRRAFPSDNIESARELYDYNIRDIEAESEISSNIPDLNDFELEFWLFDQRINKRGVQIDVDVIKKCISVINQAYLKYNNELPILTNGAITAASQVQKIRNWMKDKYGIFTPSLDAESITELLKTPLPSDVRRVLEIRELIGSAAVKKLYAMLNQVTSKGRLHDLFIYHSARTGRAAGAGPQPQNLPNSGEAVNSCECGRTYGVVIPECPWCGNKIKKVIEWNNISVIDAIETLNTGNVECVEYYFGNAIATVSGCLRGMFISASGHDLICSDYSAIEAVVLAMLAGEKWRIEVFKTHGKIYEMSASKITGRDLEEYELYKSQEGKHHPDRKLGKVAELASGYQGYIGAWKQFKADEFMTDEEIKVAVLTWRLASPAIVELWGGQQKKWKTNYFGIEGAAIQAVLFPGKEFSYRGIVYFTQQNVLYCRLLSGRHIAYHRPQLNASSRREGTLELSYEGWNTNPKMGMTGWIKMTTYGGKLVENIVQATARDLLAHAIVNLEKAGYPVVLHIHDEIVTEVPEGFGSVEEFEKIMSTLPSWAEGWPVKASNGWRAKRYGK